MDDQQLTHRARRSGAATAVLAVLLLTSCGKTSTGLTLSTPAPEAPQSGVTGAPVATPSPAAPSTGPSTSPLPLPSRSPSQDRVDERQTILTAYADYNGLLTPLSRMPAANRAAALAPYATDPLYSTVLTTMSGWDRAGTVGYGEAVLHPEIQLTTAAVAAIEDCQDTSPTGLMNRTTGKKLTVGVPRFKRSSQLKRGPDGRWRVSSIAQTAQGTC